MKCDPFACDVGTMADIEALEGKFPGLTFRVVQGNDDFAWWAWGQAKRTGATFVDARWKLDFNFWAGLANALLFVLVGSWSCLIVGLGAMAWWARGRVR